VREVQLDAVEAGASARGPAASANRPGSTRGSSRMCGRCRSVTSSRAPNAEVAELARVSTARSVVVVGGGEAAARTFASSAAAAAPKRASRTASWWRRVTLEEAREELRLLGPAPDRQEVEDLQQTAACGRRCVRARVATRLAQARHEAVVADAQQRPRSARRGCRWPRPPARPGAPSAKRPYQSSTSGA
jgi:hypothetical protein